MAYQLNGGETLGRFPRSKHTIESTTTLFHDRAYRDPFFIIMIKRKRVVRT
jgi:hypothetical protein